MKRIIGTVVALAAVLAFSTASSAAPIVFDVTGTGSVATVSQFAPNPPGFFTTPFAAGSSVTVDITGGVATLTAGTLNIIGSTPLGALGSIETNVVASVSGATGVLSGDNILWYTNATVSSTGTFGCTGAICGILGLDPNNDSYPIAALGTITGTVPVPSGPLGVWDLDATLTTILGSNREVISLGGPTPPPGPGLPAQWYLFGSADLGAVPEPGMLVLVALGLGALSLRSRKA